MAEAESSTGVVLDAAQAAASGADTLPPVNLPTSLASGNGGPPSVRPPARFGGPGLPLPPQPPGVPPKRSSYLDYLPGIYKEADFLGRYLLIFEHIFSPIQRTVGNIPHYFDPAHVPHDLIEWLGSWVGLTLDPRWPESRRRALIASAVPLYRFRGTPRGMREFLRLYTGYPPEITEPTLSQVSADRSLAFRFTVTLRVPDLAENDRSLVIQIIELEKPAFAAYTLEIVAG